MFLNWSEHQDLVRQEWETILKEYYDKILAMSETPDVKNELRNLAVSCCETAIKAETARAICHMRSAVIYEGQEDGQYDLSVFTNVTDKDSMEQILEASRKSVLKKIKTAKGVEMVQNLCETCMAKANQLFENCQWWQCLQAVQQYSVN